MTRLDGLPSPGRSCLRDLRRELRMMTLRDILPELIRKVGVSAEVVAGSEVRKLKTVGGMAAWLME